MIKVYNNSGIKAKKNAAVSSRALLFHGIKADSRRAHRTQNLDFQIGSR